MPIILFTLNGATKQHWELGVLLSVKGDELSIALIHIK